MSLTMKYFVLKPRAKCRGDQYALASRAAMLTYADIIREIDPVLADQLIGWITESEAEANQLEVKKVQTCKYCHNTLTEEEARTPCGQEEYCYSCARDNMLMGGLTEEEAYKEYFDATDG